MDATDRLAWVRVCRLDEIPPLGARVLQRAGEGDIALFRTGDDGVFAVLDRCPHKGGPLSQGIVAGDTVTCPLHGWNIGLTTGEARAPDMGCVPRFDVRVENGDVWLALARSSSFSRDRQRAEHPEPAVVAEAAPATAGPDGR